jgi:hypothetical protein
MIQAAERQRKDAANTRREAVNDRPGRLDGSQGLRLGDQVGYRDLHHVRVDPFVLRRAATFF